MAGGDLVVPWRAVFGVCCSLLLLLGLGLLTCCCSVHVTSLDIADHHIMHAQHMQRGAALAQHSDGINQCHCPCIYAHEDAWWVGCGCGPAPCHGLPRDTY